MTASAYVGLVVVDVAVVQCDCAAADVDATSILPHKEGFGQFQTASTPTGPRWGARLLLICSVWSLCARRRNTLYVDRFLHHETTPGAMGKGLVACLVASCRTHISRCVGVDLAGLEGDSA